MARLPIKRTLDRIPGGMMVVPLLLGALFGVVLGHFPGEAPVASGLFIGLSTPAVVAYTIMPLESGPS